MMLIDNKFDLGQTVYLVTDADQSPRIVTRLFIAPEGIVYELCCGTARSEHYDIEMQAEKVFQ